MLWPRETRLSVPRLAPALETRQTWQFSKVGRPDAFDRTHEDS